MRRIFLSPTIAVRSMFIQHFGIYVVVWEMCRLPDDCSHDHIYGAVKYFRCKTCNRYRLIPAIFNCYSGLARYKCGMPSDLFAAPG